MNVPIGSGDGGGGEVGGWGEDDVISAFAMQQRGNNVARGLMPGETLGREMLSRIQSGSDVSTASTLTPETMIASRVQNIGLTSGNAAGGAAAGSTAAGGNSQKMELFMQKLNMAMSPPGTGGGGVGVGVGAGGMGGGYPINSAAGMGQRSRTVGAGLAYGRADMTTVNRMSRFNLGALQKESSGNQLSQLTTGGSNAGNTNQEWNLGC